jgi:hypothetical protein
VHSPDGSQRQFFYTVSHNYCAFWTPSYFAIYEAQIKTFYVVMNVYDCCLLCFNVVSINLKILAVLACLLFFNSLFLQHISAKLLSDCLYEKNIFVCNTGGLRRFFHFFGPPCPLSLLICLNIHLHIIFCIAMMLTNHQPRSLESLVPFWLSS